MPNEIQKPPYEARAVAPKVLPAAISHWNPSVSGAPLRRKGMRTYHAGEELNEPSVTVG